MKQLILAEKPSVARDIAKVLKVNKKEKGYFSSENKIVTWALGHLVTLSTPEEYNKKYTSWNLEDLPIIPEHMKLSIIKSSRAQFNIVKELLNRKDVDEVVIATDAGREGELVARLILIMSGAKKKLKRLWISSVTDKAIREGFKNLKDAKDYNNLYESAMSRATADWIVGINASRALTVKYGASLNCGRVQTPTLNLVKIREDEIKNFKPKEYFKLKVFANNMEFYYLNKNNSMTIYDENEIEKVIDAVKDSSIKIIKIDEKLKKKYPQNLYDLTNLQRDANVRYGFSAKETANIMQNLYERHKLLTYPRTDSRFLTDDIVPTIKERLKGINTSKYKDYVKELMSKEIKPNKNFVDNSKVSDHHAIIPTETILHIEDLDSNELKIYDLVVKRFLSNLMKPYEYKEVVVIGECKNYKFRLRAKVEVDLGYKALDSYEEDEEEFSKINKLELNDVLKVNSIKKEVLYTSAPSYFNEGSLLLAMENPQKFIDVDKKDASTLKETGGIGTVATRGDIIEKLYNSDLIENNNGIKITSKGRQLLELVPEELKSPSLTAKWELDLKNIEKGKTKSNKFLDDIKKFSISNIIEIKNSNKKFKHDNLTSIKCDICGSPMLSVNRGDREFLKCSNVGCNNKKTISLLTNVRCPNCHKKLRLIMDKNIYICDTCGYRESKESMDKKFKENKAKMNTHQAREFMKKQDDSEINNSLASQLKNFKL